ncbi:DNA mismatch repair protein MutS [Christensenellaceae bacterium OttesenSCG-928-M15]|nr:DNA mismatch repair protein MutS [Christensenellaceae bacterium OttesenSCG-928-M15]
MNKIERTLEFDKIKEMLKEAAYSNAAKERITKLAPYLDEAECLRHAADTTAARTILDGMGAPPLPYMENLNDILQLAKAGSMLLPEQLSTIMQFAASAKRVKSYLKKAESVDTRIAPYGKSIIELNELYEEIERCIRYEQVDAHASAELTSLRRQIERTQAKIKERLHGLLMNNKKWFSDSFITERGGRYVLPVKREYKNMLKGAVVEVASSKSTYFMEPSSVEKLRDELNALNIEEDAEVRRILYTLTAMVDDFSPTITADMAAMEELDFVFAKAKVSQRMHANPVTIGVAREIRIVSGRHPLLSRETCVPLDFTLGGEIEGVIITGPNTGGKTVAMKTVGLLSMMAQSGLHVPADASSRFSMHAHYFCDIGDGQSITENLSTFSGHMKNVIGILGENNRESLVLLDELGSGTDPNEGMGIAIAVLEELKKSGCLFLVTTHYAEVKEYALKTPGVMSARMAFDRETLSPLYRLEQGEVGESCALYIAKRLGLPARILSRAYEEAYKKEHRQAAGATVDVSDLLDGAHAGEPVSSRAQGRQSAIKKREEHAPLPEHALGFHVGDSVLVLPQKELGIVYATADRQGMVGVQIKGQKDLYNHKRLQLKLPASELYPEDYDFSVIFDTVENRKARHQLGKGHRPGVEISYEGAKRDGYCP